MAIREYIKASDGQMTVELAIVFPVVIVIAVIAVNALQFFGLCASFDRLSHQTMRVYAASPAYGSDISQCCTQIERSLQEAFEDKGVASITVTCIPTGADLYEFTARIEYLPSLFKLGLQSEVFGVALPRLTHATSFVVDSYRPGVVV